MHHSDIFFAAQLFPPYHVFHPLILSALYHPPLRYRNYLQHFQKKIQGSEVRKNIPFNWFTKYRSVAIPDQTILVNSM
jgi:hypothetical protein